MTKRHDFGMKLAHAWFFRDRANLGKLVLPVVVLSWSLVVSVNTSVLPESSETIILSFCYFPGELAGEEQPTNSRTLSFMLNSR